MSVSIQGSSAGPFGPPAIRGVSSFGLSIGVQTQTGVVMDDVAQPSFSTLANELSDIERVEVLPGPQSTLSGRNAAGGLINIVTHNPTDTFAGHASFEQTNDHQTCISGYVSGPIADTLGFSISSYYNKYDGPLFSDQDNNRRLGGFENRGVRAKLQWKATDTLSFLLTGYDTKSDVKSPALLYGNPYIFANSAAGFDFAPGMPLSAIVPGQRIGPYNRYTSSATNSVSENENRGASLRIDLDTDLGTISSISNYSHGNQPRSDLFLAFPLGGTIIAMTDTDVKYFSQEIRPASVDSSSKLQYLLGAIRTNTKNFEPCARNFLFPVNWDCTALVKTLALFGRLTYKLVPGTRVTGGLRYQPDDQNYQWLFVDGSATTSSASSSGAFVTGEAGIQHHFGPDVMGYSTDANAQSGPANDLEDSGSAITPAGLTPISSQKVLSFKAGLKTPFFDRRVTMNLSAFPATYKNYKFRALQVSCVACTPAIRLYAVGKVRNQDVELQSTFRLAEGLKHDLAASYLDSKILDYPGAECFPGQTSAQGCNAGKQNRRERFPNTSKFRVQGNLDYTLPLPDAPVDPTFGAIGVKSHSHVWSAELLVNSLFHRNYYAGMARDLGFLQPAGGVALNATYAHDSLRCFGGRVNVHF